jgi:hypothetical protein
VPVAVNTVDDVVILPTGQGFTLVGQAPSRAFGFLLKSDAPTLLTNNIVSPSAASIGLSGKQPQILAEPPDAVAPDSGSLGLAGNEPTLKVGLPLNVGSLALSGAAPTITVNTVVDLREGILDGDPIDVIQFSSDAPTISIEFVGGHPGDGTIVENTDATEVKSNYIIDDRTGFKMKVKKGLVEDGYGHLVREDSADRRHPQERVKSTSEDYRTGAIRPEIVKEADMTFIDPDDPVTPDDL